MSDVTRIIEAAQQGDPTAADQLLPLVYDELRRLAAHKMANEAAGQTLQPTALVHEAWLRLVGNENQKWDGRAHFFAAAAEAMRRILIDRARRKRAARHGGGQQRVDIQEAELASSNDDDQLLAVSEALDKLAAEHKVEAELVKLRYFVGLTNDEAADLLWGSPNPRLPGAYTNEKTRPGNPQLEKVFAWKKAAIPESAAFAFMRFILTPVACCIWLCSSGFLFFNDASAEPLGPSSRRTGLMISEIMFHPPPRPDGKSLEFIELYNSDPFPANLSGFRFSGDVDYNFPPNTVIPGLGFLVVAPAPADVQSVYGLSGVLGGFGNLTNSLPNGDGMIRLRNKLGAILLEVNYSDQPPWPAAPDGAGHSLVLARPSLGERHPEAWAASELIGGSPGAGEPVVNDPLRSVRINEILAHTDGTELDYLELYNLSNQAVNVSGCFLSDDPSANKFTLPPDAFIPARGFVYFTQTTLGFSLSAAGETIYFKNPGQTRVIDAVRFSAQENGVSLGRSPDGAPDFQALAAKTPGLPNGLWLTRDVVINEIMYHPLSGNSDEEYLELYNQGTRAANVGAWRFTAGIEFTFPSDQTIPPGGYLVVAKNAAYLMANYPNLNASNTVGNYQATFSNRGERIRLARPEETVSTDSHGVLVTNTSYLVVDEVAFGTGGRWGQWSDGGGSSLELIDPRNDHRLAANWADSDETAKSDWTTVEFTGILDDGNSGFPINNLQIILHDAGECLVDNVEVIGPGGTNRIANSTFENGLAGWITQGTHEQSSLEETGCRSNRSLHLRATAKGDPEANRVLVPLTASLVANQTGTIRASVRWLRGHPEILFRVHGNYLEAAGKLVAPNALGTPGARNSRAATNAGPAIFEVTHSPALPAAGQPVLVTARVQDRDGVAQVAVNYRLDPLTNVTTAAVMLDDGTGGDLIAGDGIFSATIPGQSNGTLVAFHLVASDQFVPSATTKFPGDAPARECLVRFGESLPAGDFGTYRLWITQATAKKWANRPKLSNDPLDATFVYGDQRVVYNVGALFSGSPYHSPSYTTPTGAPCDYTFIFPADDAFLGETEVHLSWPGNGPDDATGQREQAAYWIAGQIGLPFNHRRFMILYVNGIRRNPIMEDTQRANSEVIGQWFPDETEGDLFKIAGWFEFNDAASDFNNDTVWATLRPYTTLDLATNQRLKKAGRYRWNFQKRILQNSASDFASLFALVDAVNTAGTDEYTAQVEALVDVEQWMRTFAVEHVVGNWDSYGNNNGQNMYAYKPADGTWKLLIWDLDIALGGSSDGPTSSLFQVADPAISRMYNHPPFRRAYFRALQDLVNGPLLSSNVNPVLDAKYAAFVTNKISAASPGGIKSYISQRRASVLSQLTKVAAPFSILINGGNDFSTNQNLATLAGTAPVGVQTIRVNGIAYHLTWTTITNWSLRIPLADGRNRLTIQGFDTQGTFLKNATAAINVTFTGSDDFPVDHLVINEIMYHPAVPGADFIEIHNTSATTAFDLTRYRLDGADFVFGEGTILPPGGFVVVAKNRTVFAAAYGSGIPVAGEFRGDLNQGGETLRLIKPGDSPDEDLVIDEVKFDHNPPWPAAADGAGSSLQLIDSTQDNNRVANWAAVNPLNTPGVAPATPGISNSVRGSLPAFPSLWINEVQPDNITGIRDRLGHRDPWIELFNHSTNTIDLSLYYLTDNYTNLARWAFPGNAAIPPGQFLIVWLDGEPGESSTNEWHAGFRLAPGTGSIALVKRLNDQPVVIDYLDFNSVEPDRSFGNFPDGNVRRRQMFYYATPNATNHNAPGPFTLFINEWMASNTRTLPNPVGGHFDDWFEIYNPNPQSIDLSGFRLTDDLANPTLFVIPPGRIIAPSGHLLIWADKQSSQNSASAPDLHVNFKLDKSGDEIGMFAFDGRLIDAVKFSAQTDDVSQGRWPDGNPAPYFSMATPTPRAANFLPPENPPTIRLVEVTISPSGFAALSWAAQSGSIYRLQYKNRPTDASWLDVPGDVFAFSGTASKTDADAGASAQRFYRVMLVH